MPGSLPSDIRLRCVDHPEFETNAWTPAWNHTLAAVVDGGHGAVAAQWLLLGTGVTEE